MKIPRIPWACILSFTPCKMDPWRRLVLINYELLILRSKNEAYFPREWEAVQFRGNDCTQDLSVTQKTRLSFVLFDRALPWYSDASSERGLRHLAYVSNTKGHASAANSLHCLARLSTLNSPRDTWMVTIGILRGYKRDDTQGIGLKLFH